MATAIRTKAPENGAQQIINEALRMLDEGRQFSGGIYISPEVYELEKDRVFKREWLAIGRVEHFEKPGDYKAFRIVDEPIVVCRDKDGNIIAYRNVCRHRGVEVAAGEGNVNNVTCPYHAWE